MGDNMNYNEVLNNIYSQFKNSDQYMANPYVKFFMESNTNIINFEANDINYGIIKGTIIDQSNSVLIYFHAINYIVLSKANINRKNIATITNVLLDKGDIKMTETVKRKFEQRKDLYKASSYDEFIDNNELDSEFIYLISNIRERYSQKSKKYI